MVFFTISVVMIILVICMIVFTIYVIFIIVIITILIVIRSIIGSSIITAIALIRWLLQERGAELLHGTLLAVPVVLQSTLAAVRAPCLPGPLLPMVLQSTLEGKCRNVQAKDFVVCDDC